MAVTEGTNGNSKKREQTATRIIAAIHESQGLLTLASKRAGVSYRTINRYVAEFPTVKEAAQQAREQMLDFAESKLFQKIRDGDNTCIIFYLKCQGKHRGYVERQEFANPPGESFKVEHDAKSKLIQALNRLSERRKEKEENGEICQQAH